MIPHHSFAPFARLHEAVVRLPQAPQHQAPLRRRQGLQVEIGSHLADDAGALLGGVRVAPLWGLGEVGDAPAVPVLQSETCVRTICHTAGVRDRSPRGTAPRAH